MILGVCSGLVSLLFPPTCKVGEHGREDLDVVVIDADQPSFCLALNADRLEDFARNRVLAMRLHDDARRDHRANGHVALIFGERSRRTMVDDGLLATVARTTDPGGTLPN